MSVEIVEVSLRDRKLVDRFIKVPWLIHRELYPNNHWVPPLWMDRRDYLNLDKNPFYAHADVALWIARKDGRDVGRIAAIEDRDWIKFQREQTGYFGMFECPDDPEIAAALFAKAREWLRGRKLTKMIGPMDFSTNYVCGVLLDAFDRDPGINMPYNPPWYDALIQGQGLTKAKDLIQWHCELSNPVPERIERICTLLQKRENITIRAMSFSDWDAEVGRALDVYNDAWDDNWGFVPVGEAEFRHIATDLKMVLHPTLPLMCEVEGRPVAFALIIMNVNPVLKKLDGKLFPFGVFRLIWDLKIAPKVDSGRLILLGIRSGYRKRGLDSLLFLEMYKRTKALGWWGGEIGWTLEDNVMVNRAIENFGSKPAAHYRIYQHELSPAAVSPEAP